MPKTKKRELLFSVTKKDFIIQPYKGSGAGGQHRNKTMSCCRMIHPDSGARAQACEERNFHRNRKVAFRRLVTSTTFELWRKKKAYEIIKGKREEEKLLDKIERSMRPDNIKTEVYDTQNKKWIEYKGDFDENCNPEG